MANTPDISLEGAGSKSGAALSVSSAVSSAASPVTSAGAGRKGVVNPAMSLSLAGPGDYFALMKPRVMSLVIFTAFIGMVVAPGDISFWQGAAALLCIAIGAGASAALNMWYDADIDAQMTRTRTRPVPRGLITATSARTFGILLSVVSVWSLYHTTNWVAAALLAFTIFFYVVIYTMGLKRRTPQNIVIGGTPGALPPMIGWATVTGDVTLGSLALFLIIFMWTPPHFWALALYKRGDYEKVGIPMLPNVKGAGVTRNHIMAYAGVLAIVCCVPVVIGLSGWLYAGSAVLLNAGFLFLSFKVWRSQAGERHGSSAAASLYDVKRGDKAARNLFAFSILYLFGLFGALGFDAVFAGVL